MSTSRPTPNLKSISVCHSFTSFQCPKLMKSTSALSFPNKASHHFSSPLRPPDLLTGLPCLLSPLHMLPRSLVCVMCGFCQRVLKRQLRSYPLPYSKNSASGTKPKHLNLPSRAFKNTFQPDVSLSHMHTLINNLSWDQTTESFFKSYAIFILYYTVKFTFWHPVLWILVDV